MTVAHSSSIPQLVLRPRDQVVLLRLALEQGPAPTYAALSAEMGLTASEAHAAVERAAASGLVIINAHFFARRSQLGVRISLLL